MFRYTESTELDSYFYSYKQGKNVISSETFNSLGDPASQSTHSSLSPNSFSSPSSEEVLAPRENERRLFGSPNGNSPSSSRQFQIHNPEEMSNNCGMALPTSVNSKTESIRSRLSCDADRACTYENNEDSSRERSFKTYGTQENNPLLFGSILEGFNPKGLDNYPALPFMQSATTRAHSTLPILNSGSSNLDYNSRSDYAAKTGFYGSFSDNSLYHPNSQPLTGLKNGSSYGVQNNMTTFYQTNQHAYNPFASSSSYNNTAPCDYGSTVLSHPAGNLAGSRPYGYVGSSELWNGSGSTIGYDAPGVAAAAAATGVAAAAAAAAAINYGASMNHHHSSYMAGIASQYAGKYFEWHFISGF